MEIRTMRKSLAFTAAAATAALLLAGCSSPEPSGDDGKIELEFWHGYTEADGKVLDDLVAELTPRSPRSRSPPSPSLGRRCSIPHCRR
jgi:hypothetical protein